MTIQEEVDAWYVEPSTGSDPKDAEILTKRILHAVVPFCKQKLKKVSVNAGAQLMITDKN
ncbi:hypothetical protein P7H04_24930 [Paenibacillus larvae]|nr:hypothetical protein [Paenibacillus larvae]